MKVSLVSFEINDPLHRSTISQEANMSHGGVTYKIKQERQRYITYKI